MKIETIKDLRAALDSGPYAWPGGYPCYFITNDGAALSFDSVQSNIGEIEDSIERRLNDGRRVVAMAINWEDPDLICDDSGKHIEAAYA